MIQLSNEVLKEVGEKYRTWDNRTTLIGDMMNKFSQFMLVYTDYFKQLN